PLVPAHPVVGVRGSRWAVGTDPVGGPALPRLSLEPEGAGLGRVVVLLGDQPLVQHLLVLGQLGDRVLGLRRRGLRWRLRRWWLLPARRWLLPALLRVALRRVPLRAALRRGALPATLRWAPPRDHLRRA